MRKDIMLLTLVMAVFSLILGWGVYEKHVENASNFMSIEDKMHQAEKFMRQDIGQYIAKVDLFIKQLEETRNHSTQAVAQGMSASKRVDDMQAYFQKYSSEAMEERVKEYKKQLDNLANKVENPDMRQLDERYALKSRVDNLSHLPDQWAWNQQTRMWTDSATRSERLEKLVQQVIEANKLKSPPPAPAGKKDVRKDEPVGEEGALK